MFYTTFIFSRHVKMFKKSITLLAHEVIVIYLSLFFIFFDQEFFSCEVYMDIITLILYSAFSRLWVTLNIE